MNLSKEKIKNIVETAKKALELYDPYIGKQPIKVEDFCAFGQCVQVATAYLEGKLGEPMSEREILNMLEKTMPDLNTYHAYHNIVHALSIPLPQEEVRVGELYDLILEWDCLRRTNKIVAKKDLSDLALIIHSRLYGEKGKG